MRWYKYNAYVMKCNQAVCNRKHEIPDRELNLGEWEGLKCKGNGSLLNCHVTVLVVVAVVIVMVMLVVVVVVVLAMAVVVWW